MVEHVRKNAVVSHVIFGDGILCTHRFHHLRSVYVIRIVLSSDPVIGYHTSGRLRSGSLIFYKKIINDRYADRINSRGMSRVFCDLRSQKTPRGTLPVNSNELFHITVHPDVHFFQGMGNILIPERSSGQISIQPSHLSFIKLCVRRIFLLDRPA